MTTRRQVLKAALAGMPACVAAGSAMAQSAIPAPVTSPPAPLFAVEFRTGPRWDTSKPPREQANFRDHSANLKRLRDEGLLVVGARYSDKGFIVVAAATENEVRAEIEKDPSVQAQVFQYEVHPLMVFYPGCLAAARRPA